jgi:putative FmdB family regulatory protein
MPIYDYHCDHCGHAFSAVQRFVDDAIAACPSCGKPPRRLLSNPALVFKGSGWYKTDSRGPEKKESGAGGKDAGKDGGASTDPAQKTAAGDRSENPEKAGSAPGENAAARRPEPGQTDRSGKADKADKADGAGRAEKTGGGSGGEASAPAKKPEKAAPASS